MSLDERIDPVELLSSYTAPVGWDESVELTGPDTDAAAVSLLERILGGWITATGPRRRHLRLVTGVVVAASLGGAAVAAAAILARGADETRTLSCWSEPALPPGQQVGLWWDGVDDPVDACTMEWRSGGLGSDGPPEPLQACVTVDGVAAVVPGDEATCGRLGLAELAQHDPVDAESSRLVDLTELELQLSEEFNFGRCLTPAAASDGVRERLDELGYSDWSVSVAATSSGDETCATVAVEQATDSVSIVMIAPDR